MDNLASAGILKVKYRRKESEPATKKAHLRDRVVCRKHTKFVKAMYEGPIKASTPPELDDKGRSTSNWPRVGFGAIEYTEVRDNPIGGGVWADGVERLERSRFTLNLPDRKTAERLARALQKHLAPQSPSSGRAAAGVAPPPPASGRAAVAQQTPVRRTGPSGRQSLTPDMHVTFGLEGFLQHKKEEQERRSKNVQLRTAADIQRDDNRLKDGRANIGDLFGVGAS